MWKDENPVQLAGNLSLPGGFKLGAYGSKYCDVITATGAYSCLRVELLFVRQLSFFVVTVYVPCTMTVSVSWMSFWLDHKAVPARVALGVTTLLAMSTTQASIQNSLPPVAYTKVRPHPYGFSFDFFSTCLHIFIDKVGFPKISINSID